IRLRYFVGFKCASYTIVRGRGSSNWLFGLYFTPLFVLLLVFQYKSTQSRKLEGVQILQHPDIIRRDIGNDYVSCRRADCYRKLLYSNYSEVQYLVFLFCCSRICCESVYHRGGKELS